MSAEAQIVLLPETGALELVCFAEALDTGEDITYCMSNINKTDDPDVDQVIMTCPKEDCNAELEVFSQRDGLGFASAPTPETVDAMRIVCKQRKENQ
jgi:hypothetical protein